MYIYVDVYIEGDHDEIKGHSWQTMLDDPVMSEIRCISDK